MPSDDAELENVAVLLVPTNTTVFLPRPHRVQSFMENLDFERYRGPARVFLPPGKRYYMVRVRTADGDIDLELEADFEPGKRYELAIVDDDERVAFELFELHR
jgi:hypothetical protein